MKKRRTLVISLLLIAALALGIGYAGVSTQLVIRTTAASEVQAMDVGFTAGSMVSTTKAHQEENYTITVDDGYDEATLNGKTVIRVEPSISGLRYSNDTVVLEYTITNNNDYAVKVKAPVVSLPAETVLDVTTDWGTAEKTLGGIHSGTGANTATVTVTIKLNTASADPITENFNITFEAYAGNQGGTQSN